MPIDSLIDAMSTLRRIFLLLPPDFFLFLLLSESLVAEMGLRPTLLRFDVSVGAEVIPNDSSGILERSRKRRQSRMMQSAEVERTSKKQARVEKIKIKQRCRRTEVKKCYGSPSTLALKTSRELALLWRILTDMRSLRATRISRKTRD